jgi:hypothetical protein
MQDDMTGAEAVLYPSIAADPSQMPNWTKLASLRASAGRPLKRLQLQRHFKVDTSPDGTRVVLRDRTASGDTENPDNAVGMMLALAEFKALSTPSERKLTPFDIELWSWRKAMEVADKVHARTGKALTDPALLQMQALNREGQLAPAILILLYKESYRPALEQWTAAPAGGAGPRHDRWRLHSPEPNAARWQIFQRCRSKNTQIFPRREGFSGA